MSVLSAAHGRSRYTLLERIGQGGAADVFKAVLRGDDRSERLCVIKRIRADKQQSVALAQMLADEGRIMECLRHPNIVGVYQHGAVEDTYILVMEYLAGEDLAGLVATLAEQGRTLPVSQAVFIAQQVAEGLSYAHAMTDEHGRPVNLVHRDVSPANIMVLYTGEVKILDFGVARVAEFVRQGRTIPGRVKGKAAYMAPEQVRGKPLDARTDVFALGIVLWEALAGRRLFSEPNVQRTMSNVLTAQILPPSHHRADLPPGLDEAVLRALARDPAERFSSAEAFSQALQPFLRVEPKERAQLSRLMRDLFPRERRTRGERKRREITSLTRGKVFTDLNGLHPDLEGITPVASPGPGPTTSGASTAPFEGATLVEREPSPAPGSLLAPEGTMLAGEIPTEGPLPGRSSFVLRAGIVAACAISAFVIGRLLFDGGGFTSTAPAPAPARAAGTPRAVAIPIAAPVPPAPAPVPAVETPAPAAESAPVAVLPPEPRPQAVPTPRPAGGRFRAAPPRPARTAPPAAPAPRPATPPAAQARAGSRELRLVDPFER